jgi:translation initiation factor IF-3
VPEVLVIDSDGQKLGVMPTFEALRRAQEQGLNLVEVSPDSRPPVCKVLDYGKYKYDLKQDQKRRKKNQVVIELKELKFRVKVEKHDFETKLRHAERFLGEGDKVKCTIMFRGREMAHPHLGEAVLQRVLEEVGAKVIVEQTPKLEGRNMTMLLAPKPGAWPKPTKPKPPEDRKAEPKKAGGKPEDGVDTAPVDDEDEDDLDEDDGDDEGDDEGEDEGED